MTTADPFTFGRPVPYPLLLLAARMPLVHTTHHYSEMRIDCIEAARIPGLYLDGIDLAQMGGAPYSEWN